MSIKLSIDNVGKANLIYTTFELSKDNIIISTYSRGKTGKDHLIGINVIDKYYAKHIAQFITT
jgi:hypothetical protein